LTLLDPALLPDPDALEAQTVEFSRFSTLRAPATAPALRARP
jgi:hypothetical protein